MNNDPMYNTFVKDRSNNGNSGLPDYMKPKPSVSAVDLPDFDFDADDVLEDPDTGSTGAGFTPMGVDHNLNGYSGLNSQQDAGSQDRPRSLLEELEDAYARPDLSKNAYTEPFEFEDGCISLPTPEIFNSYPPEVQRKIMEWTDRDIKARRDDESRRQDTILRANIARERNRVAIPVVIIVLLVVCAFFSGVFTRNAVFSIAFLTVAVVVIIAFSVGRSQRKGKGDAHQQPGR